MPVFSLLYKCHEPDQTPCNCNQPESCPLDGDCNAENIVYKATVEATNKPTMVYYGLSEPVFKFRHSNHNTSIRHERYRNATELSKNIWKLRESDGLTDNDISVS